METTFEIIIHSEQFRIKKINRFLLENEETLIQGKFALFNDKHITCYIALFEKNGYNVESIPATSQLKISL